MSRLLIIISLFFFSDSSAQEIFTKKNADSELIKIMKKNKLISIGFFSKTKYHKISKEFNLFIAQSKKTKKWGVMKSQGEWNSSKHEYLVAPIYDSIGDLTNENSKVLFKRNNKYGIAELDWEQTEFDPVGEFDRILILKEEDGDYTLVSKNKKWGLFLTTYNLQALPCTYSNASEVPLFEMPEYIYEYYATGIKKYGFSGYKPDNNGDGLFYACNKQGKWGLFQMDNQIIPMQYDSILPMSFNAPFLIVYNNGKAGIYSEPFGEPKLTVACEYDQLIRFTSNGYFLAAIRKEDKWAILDWYTGELLTDYRYESFEALRVPYGVKSKYYD